MFTKMPVIKSLCAVAALATCVAIAPPAKGETRVGISLGVAPGYYAPAPAYYAPRTTVVYTAPAYYAPAPVYYAPTPAPVVYAPAPVYYQAPVTVASPPVVYTSPAPTVVYQPAPVYYQPAPLIQFNPGISLGFRVGGFVDFGGRGRR